MKTVQKFVIHPITALFFAFAVTRFIHHFQILEFSYAAVLSFILVFLGYVLLSRKYDPILSYIFLAGALFIGFKALQLPERIHVISEKPDQLMIKKLNSLAALVKYSEIETGKLPNSLREVGGDLIEVKGFNFFLCQKNKDCQQELSRINQRSQFYIVATKVNDENLKSTWLVDDSFVVFKKNQTGDIQKIFP